MKFKKLRLEVECAVKDIIMGSYAFEYNSTAAGLKGTGFH